MDEEAEFTVAATPRIAETLRARRRELKLTQAEIAGLAGLLPKTVSALENKPERCGLESLLKLCAFLGLELSLSLRPAGLGLGDGGAGESGGEDAPKGEDAP